MLPAAARLRSSREHRLVTRHGRRARKGALVVVMLRSPAEAGEQSHGEQDGSSGARFPPRAGVVVGRNVGGAVVRSRVKRRLREVLRARFLELPVGSLTVIRALPGADVPYPQLESWVRSALGALDRGTGGTGGTGIAPHASPAPRGSAR